MSKKKKKEKEEAREYRKFFCGWLPKVAERLQIIQYNVRDHADLKEDDWEVLKTAYKWYHFGELSQFMPEVSPPQEKTAKVTEQMLFPTDNVTQETIGTSIVDTKALTLKEEKDE